MMYGGFDGQKLELQNDGNEFWKLYMHKCVDNGC